MDRSIFDEVACELPLLTADGFAFEGSPFFGAKRQDFLHSDRILHEFSLLRDSLQSLQKSQRFSEWQRKNCVPERLVDYFEFRLGQSVSPGSIIAAAVSLGFTMGVHDGQTVYFNFSAEAIESGLAELRSREQIEKVKLS